MKIYIISDLHPVLPGAISKEPDPEARLRWALDDFAANHGDADLCLLLGDLTDHGEPGAY